VPPHQDWTFVDETRFRSFNVWTPLTDVDLDNGALGVIHGSHRFFGNQLRVSPSPQCRSLTSDHLVTLFPFLDVKPLHAGQAIVFDNATIHGSPPNITDVARIATGLVVTHAEAELCHHYQLPNTDPPEIETYAIGRQFFMQYGNEALSRLFDAGEHPRAASVQRRPYVLEKISQQELLNLVQGHPENRYNEVLVQRVQAALGQTAKGSREPASRVATTGGTDATVRLPSSAVQHKERKPVLGNLVQAFRSKVQAIFGRAATPRQPGDGSPGGKRSPGDPARSHDSDAAEAVGRFYDERHLAFLQVYGDVIQAFRTKDVADLLDYQIESMGLADGQRVLDAGCGVAGPAIHFARARDVEVEAITISEAQAEDARRRVREAGLVERIRVSRGDYHGLDALYPPEHFDLVYFLESFGHSHDKRRVLEACLAVLRPGGILYVKDLFQKEPIVPEHAEPIRREIEKINSAYHYQIADLYEVLGHVRRMGFILASLKTVDLTLDKFENLTISNDFQELTGIARIDDWATYIFPVEFYEMKCIKPSYAIGSGSSRYFLQNLYHMQVLGTRQKDL
jgi:ubiquinone/menaquinone biosynthesis C-methylase UbiE